MKILKATSKDYAVLSSFRYLLLKHDSLYCNISPQKIKNSLLYLKENLLKKDNFYFIAYEKGTPLGYIHFCFNDPLDKNAGYVSELYVLPSFRKKGIGTLLMKKYFSVQKKKKMTLFLVSTSKNNFASIKFYKKLGYDVFKENKGSITLIKSNNKKEKE